MIWCYVKSVSCVRLLGVKIDNRLCFDDNASSICSKVSVQISALRRIVNFLSLENHISIYNAFIASNFNILIRDCTTDSAHTECEKNICYEM